METIAENSFTVTKQIYREGILRLMKEDLGGFQKKALTVLGVMWLALTGYTVYTGGGFFYAIFGLLVLALVSLWMLVWIPNGKVKRAWRAMEARSGDVITRTVKFYEDCLTVDNGSEVKTVNYETIRRRLESQHLLILVNDEKLGVMVALDGFTKGDKETVLKALDEWV